MASFTMQRCRLRENKLVPMKEPPAEFSWEELLKRVAPSKSTKAKIQLRKMQTGAFVGVTKTPQGETSNFLLLNTNRTGKIDWLLRQDPTFAARLVEVFRVESVKWDDKLEEFHSPAS